METVLLGKIKMKEYIVRGNEEIYGMNDKIEEERILPWIEVKAGSLQEAFNLGERRLQEEFCKTEYHIARVDLIFNKKNMHVLYKSERIKKQNEERAGEKFDLYSAIKDGICIDESGIGTCGAGV
jgi:hypothetical protein